MFSTEFFVFIDKFQVREPNRFDFLTSCSEWLHVDESYSGSRQLILLAKLWPRYGLKLRRKGGEPACN